VLGVRLTVSSRGAARRAASRLRSGSYVAGGGGDLAKASGMAASRIRWDRVGRWALICVFAFVLYLYIGPARTWVTTYGEAKRKRDEVAQVRAQNERLRERKRELEQAGAVELEARRLGMVKGGEKLYVIK